MSSPADRRLTEQQAASLVAVTEPWLSCDDCFERVDAYVDALLGSGARLDQPLRVHLARCPACFEEAESLIGLVAESDGVSPAEAIAAFHDDVAKSR